MHQGKQNSGETMRYYVINLKSLTVASATLSLTTMYLRLLYRNLGLDSQTKPLRYGQLRINVFPNTYNSVLRGLVLVPILTVGGPRVAPRIMAA